MSLQSTRFITALTLLLTLPFPVCGQETAEKGEDVSELTELTVSPRAIERPLLKYRLLPAEYELQDGNAAPILLRLPWDQPNLLSGALFSLEEYLELPLDDASGFELERVFPQKLYKELRRAAFRRTAEWEYPTGEERMADIRLPDVQGVRTLIGSGLSVRIRFHIANGNVDQAMEELLVGLANVRHYARTPILAVQGMCAANHSILLARLEELLGHSECPNLYWALSASPRPYIDLRPSAEQEQRLLAGTLHRLANCDTPKSEEEWSHLARSLLKLSSKYESSQLTDESLELAIGKLATRSRVEAADWHDGDPSLLIEMSDYEAAVRWCIVLNTGAAQEMTSYFSLEPPLAIARLQAHQQRREQRRSKIGISTLVGNEYPLRIYLATQKIQRKIDALRVVEAIRDYAATHDSRLPDTLDEITETPVPNDPLTGKSFQYEVQGTTGTLFAPGFDINGRDWAVINYRIKIRNE